MIKLERQAYYWRVCVCVCACTLSHFSHVQLFASLWTVAHQAPLSMGFSRQRILEWVAMPSSRGSSRPRDRTHIPYVSCPGREILYYYCHLGSLSLPVPSLHSNVGTHLLTSRVIPSSWLPSGLALTSVDWKGK